MVPVKWVYCGAHIGSGHEPCVHDTTHACRGELPSWRMNECGQADQELVSKLCGSQVDHVKQAFDYKPFIREFIMALLLPR